MASPERIHLRNVRDCGLSHTGTLARGKWANSDASPLPTNLDRTISLVVSRDTLTNRLRALGELTSVPVFLNASALQIEGITKNQTVGMDVHNQPAHQVLQIILNRSDTQGRLRAVLRATDSGEEGIDITTKQALTNESLTARP